MLLHKKITASELKKVIPGLYELSLSAGDHWNNGKESQLELGRMLSLGDIEYVVTKVDKEVDGAHKADIANPISFAGGADLNGDFQEGTFLEWVLDDSGDFKVYKNQS